MPLVLSMKEGEGFNIDHLSIDVDKIFSGTEFRLRCGDIYLYVSDHPLHVAEGVRIKSGLRGQKRLARVWIDADKKKKISRKT